MVLEQEFYDYLLIYQPISAILWLLLYPAPLYGEVGLGWLRVPVRSQYM
jgi:hypothetical protein